jgi:hypothetical protein
VTGRCDTAAHACVYDVCKQPQACLRAACDATAKTCGEATSIDFAASTFKVTSGGVGCNSVAAACIAAAYPYLFVGTTNGVVAYSIADPGGAPSAIPVGGVPFLPDRIVASGGRVYLVGAVLGSGPTYHVPIAWVDVPADPFATSITAEVALQTTSQDTIAAAFSAPDAGVFLVHGDASTEFATALARAPLADLAGLVVKPNAGVANGAAPVASSGARLVFYRWDQTQQAYAGFFSFESSAGTATATATPEQGITVDMGKVYSFGQIAPGPGGALVWGASVVEQIGLTAYGTALARVAWLVGSETDTGFATSVHADVEAYDPTKTPFTEQVIGPLAMIDASTTLVLARNPASLAQTSVQVATRNGTSATLVASRRAVLSVAVDKLGAAAANGFGYVLADDATDSATVYVFAPACAAGTVSDAGDAG